MTLFLFSNSYNHEAYQNRSMAASPAELQIRGGIEDNSLIIFLISQ